MAAATTRIGLATGVTCPSFRYHPAIIAQAAATVQILSDNRFTLGVGAGERLNEHIVGDFPSVGSGTSASARRSRSSACSGRAATSPTTASTSSSTTPASGTSLTSCRSSRWPSSGPASAPIAAELGDGLFATEPKSSMVEAYGRPAARARRYAEVPMAWAPDDETARQGRARDQPLGGHRLEGDERAAEPVNFEAASATVRPEDVPSSSPSARTSSATCEHVQQYVDAGFDHIVLQNAGPDPEGFVDFFTRQLADRLRTLTPSAARALNPWGARRGAPAPANP